MTYSPDILSNVRGAFLDGWAGRTELLPKRDDILLRNVWNHGHAAAIDFYKTKASTCKNPEAVAFNDFLCAVFSCWEDESPGAGQDCSGGTGERPFD